MMSEYMTFECMQCSKLFERKWYEVSRAFERVHFMSPTRYDEVEVAYSEGIGEFCSQACLNLGLPTIMEQQCVPIPAVRPGIEPIESCAKCSGPVDMSDWHLTYTSGCFEDTGSGIKILDVDYIVVVCRECAPCVQTAGAQAARVADEPSSIGASARREQQDESSVLAHEPSGATPACDVRSPARPAGLGVR
jgi:hypothetical protein